MIVPLIYLVAHLREDKFFMGGDWFVYCPRCEKDYHIWPDKDNIACGECGQTLVSVVGGLPSLEIIEE